MAGFKVITEELFPAFILASTIGWPRRGLDGEGTATGFFGAQRLVFPMQHRCSTSGVRRIILQLPNDPEETEQACRAPFQISHP
jgi:hypothetical protein